MSERAGFVLVLTALLFRFTFSSASHATGAAPWMVSARGDSTFEASSVGAVGGAGGAGVRGTPRGNSRLMRRAGGGAGSETVLGVSGGGGNAVSRFVSQSGASVVSRVHATTASADAEFRAVLGGTSIFELLSSAVNDTGQGSCTKRICVAKGVPPIPDPKEKAFSTIAWAPLVATCGKLLKESDCVEGGCTWIQTKPTHTLQCVPRNVEQLLTLNLDGCGWYKKVHAADPCLPASTSCDDKNAEQCMEKTDNLGGQCPDKTTCSMRPDTQETYAAVVRGLLPELLDGCFDKAYEMITEADRKRAGVKCLHRTLPEGCKMKRLLSCMSHQTETGCADGEQCLWVGHKNCTTGNTSWRCTFHTDSALEIVGSKPERDFLKQMADCSKMAPCQALAPAAMVSLASTEDEKDKLQPAVDDTEETVAADAAVIAEKEEEEEAEEEDVTRRKKKNEEEENDEEQVEGEDSLVKDTMRSEKGETSEEKVQGSRGKHKIQSKQRKKRRSPKKAKTEEVSADEEEEEEDKTARKKKNEEDEKDEEQVEDQDSLVKDTIRREKTEGESSEESIWRDTGETSEEKGQRSQGKYKIQRKQRVKKGSPKKAKTEEVLEDEEKEKEEEDKTRMKKKDEEEEKDEEQVKNEDALVQDTIRSEKTEGESSEERLWRESVETSEEKGQRSPGKDEIQSKQRKKKRSPKKAKTEEVLAQKEEEKEEKDEKQLDYEDDSLVKDTKRSKRTEGESSEERKAQRSQDKDKVKIKKRQEKRSPKKDKRKSASKERTSVTPKITKLEGAAEKSLAATSLRPLAAMLVATVPAVLLQRTDV